MHGLKKGDTVRHEGGWYATVTEVRLNTVIVAAADRRNSGEYAYVVFTKVDLEKEVPQPAEATMNLVHPETKSVGDILFKKD